MLLLKIFLKYKKIKTADGQIIEKTAKNIKKKR